MVSKKEQLTGGIDFGELDVHGILETLADGRYRRVLYRLIRNGGRAELDELARVSSDDEHAAIRLHHVVLPKLDDIGLLEYDPESHVVVLARTVPRERDFLLRFRPLADYVRS